MQESCYFLNAGQQGQRCEISIRAVSNLSCSLIYASKHGRVVMYIRVSPRQFQKGAAPCLPFHRMKSALTALHSKIAPFLPFSKKRRKWCLFTMFIYILNMTYTFKLKSAFGNQKCALKNIKSALFLLSAPCPFFSLRETLHLCVFKYHKIIAWRGVPKIMCAKDFRSG